MIKVYVKVFHQQIERLLVYLADFFPLAFHLYLSSTSKYKVKRVGGHLDLGCLVVANLSQSRGTGGERYSFQLSLRRLLRKIMVFLAGTYLMILLFVLFFLFFVALESFCVRIHVRFSSVFSLKLEKN